VSDIASSPPTTAPAGIVRTASATPRVGSASEPAARAVGVLLLLAVGVVHLLDAPGTYHGTRYVFWLYVALMVGTVILAGVLLHTGDAWAWAVAGTLSALVLVAYVLSRTRPSPCRSRSPRAARRPARGRRMSSAT
jgi:hypothetical protein